MDANTTIEYVPQHPLPQEIQSMQQEDTICKFCGVSYLIHNEVKRIQKLLEEAQKEVDRLRHHDEREAEFNMAISELKIQISGLSNEIECEKQKYTDTIRSLDEANMKVEQLERSIQEHILVYDKVKLNYTSKFSSLNISCQNTLSGLHEVRKAHTELRGIFKVYQQNFPLVLQDLKISILREYKAMVDQEASLTEKMDMKLKKFEEDLRVSKNENEEYLSELLETKRKLDREVTDKSTISNQLEKFKMEEEKAKKGSNILIQNLELQITELKEKLNHFKDATNKDEKALKRTVDEKSEEVKALKIERMKTIEAHQHRIQELRESFAEKMKEIDRWPQKLQDEIEERTRANEEEIKVLKSKLDLEHKKEIEDLEVKFKLQLKNEKKSFEDKEITMNAKMKKLQGQFENQMKNQHLSNDELKSQHLNQVNDLKVEILQLTKQLKELHNSKQQQDFKSLEKDREAYEHTLSALRESLDDSKNQVLSKEDEIERCLAEINSLRDCVRRECEERYELTEALSNARTELLSLQRFQPHTNNNKTPSKTPEMIPKPPSQGRKSSLSSPSSSEENWTKARQSVNDKNGRPKVSSSLASNRSSSLASTRSKEPHTGSSFKHKLRLSLKNS